MKLFMFLYFWFVRNLKFTGSYFIKKNSIHCTLHFQLNQSGCVGWHIVILRSKNTCPKWRLMFDLWSSKFSLNFLTNVWEARSSVIQSSKFGTLVFVPRLLFIFNDIFLPLACKYCQIFTHTNRKKNEFVFILLVC